MKKFTVCNDFKSIFPDACFGIVVVKNAKNTTTDNAVFEQLLRSAEKESEKYTLLEPLSANPVVAEWREAFTKFKTKKGARASIEALLKRVKQGGQLRSISPIVDVYNSISLNYGVSCGAEDIDTFDGDLLLTIANGNEAFCLIDSEENQPPHAGEIVYKDNAGAVCRCFNWRESKRTMITEKSRNVFMIIEMPNSDRIETLKNAIDEMAHLVSKHISDEITTHILTKENSSIVIG
jgi:DNA/RNA-binding domain of Phe-tRNA-synthetase-like protein